MKRIRRAMAAALASGALLLLFPDLERILQP